MLKVPDESLFSGPTRSRYGGRYDEPAAMAECREDERLHHLPSDRWSLATRPPSALGHFGNSTDTRSAD